MRFALVAVLLSGCVIDPSDKPTPFDEVACALEWNGSASPAPATCSLACERPPMSSVTESCSYVVPPDERALPCSGRYVADFDGARGCCSIEGFLDRPGTTVVFRECL